MHVCPSNTWRSIAVWPPEHARLRSLPGAEELCFCEQPKSVDGEEEDKVNGDGADRESVPSAVLCYYSIATPYKFRWQYLITAIELFTTIIWAISCGISRVSRTQRTLTLSRAVISDDLFILLLGDIQIGTLVNQTSTSSEKLKSTFIKYTGRRVQFH